MIKGKEIKTGILKLGQFCFALKGCSRHCPYPDPLTKDLLLFLSFLHATSLICYLSWRKLPMGCWKCFTCGQEQKAERIVQVGWGLTID